MSYLQAFSHPGPVQILSGGLPAWSRASLPVDTSAPAPINPHSSDEPKQPTWGPIFAELLYSKRPKIESYFIADVEAHFGDYPEPTLRKDQAVRSYEEIVENNRKGEDDSSREVVLDARPAGRSADFASETFASARRFALTPTLCRFHGTSPEPRASLSSGHMPQALSLPSSALVEDGTLLPAAKLEQVFLSALGGDKELWEAIKSGERRVTATCGSGMTAAILWAALEVVREATGAASEIAIYDEVSLALSPQGLRTAGGDLVYDESFCSHLWQRSCRAGPDTLPGIRARLSSRREDCYRVGGRQVAST